MAKLLVCFLLLLISLSLVTSQVGHELEAELTKNRKVKKGRNGSGSLRSSQCPEQCSRRCSRTQYQKPCMFFCQKCCRKCLCVPPGFYGNKQVCACYNNWKTKRGGPKCP